MTVLKLTPFYDFKIWGGSKIAAQFNLESKEKIGEAWLVSTHPMGPSIAPDGTKLNQLTQLPYLVKLIDTSDNLSIQVHPTNEYAKVHEKDSGKSECWIIKDAEPGAGIFAGFKSGVTKEIFKKALEAKEDLSVYLQFHKVQPYDFIYIPAGLVHSIGKGITLLEVQQSSGITYRVWDWNRLENGKPRALHVEKSFEVLNFDSKFNQLEIKKLDGRFIFEGIELSFTKAASQNSIEINSTDKKSLVSFECFGSLTVLPLYIQIDNGTTVD